jgi:hypothetical protein
MDRAIVLPIALAGCVEHLEEDRTSVGRVTRDCIVPEPSGIAALGAPASVEHAASSLWIWQALATRDGGLVLNAYAAVGEAGELCASGPALVRAADGSPAALVALTDDEVAANAARRDGRRRFLVVTGGFVHEGRAHVFYELRDGAGLLDAETLGTGLCVVPSPGAPCSRVGLRLPDRGVTGAHLHRVATLGVGVRLAFGRSWSPAP